MGDLERSYERTAVALRSTAAAPVAGTLEGVRQAGERLLAVADDVIRRALSGDSQEFMRASRQEGGQ